MYRCILNKAADLEHILLEPYPLAVAITETSLRCGFIQKIGREGEGVTLVIRNNVDFFEMSGVPDIGNVWCWLKLEHNRNNFGYGISPFNSEP